MRLVMSMWLPLARRLLLPQDYNVAAQDQAGSHQRRRTPGEPLKYCRDTKSQGRNEYRGIGGALGSNTAEQREICSVPNNGAEDGQIDKREDVALRDLEEERPFPDNGIDKEQQRSIAHSKGCTHQSRDSFDLKTSRDHVAEGKQDGRC